MVRSKLSITIPTYNRSEILIEGLYRILGDLIKYQIPVYISDDSNNELTRIAIDRFKKEYENIFYVRNEPSLGHDLNCLSTINLSDSDYVWYLGDSIIIEDGSIDRVLLEVNKGNADVICFYADRVNDISVPSQNFTDLNELIDSLAWHLTMTGVTIYRRAAMNAVNLKVSNFKNFPQVALIFEIMIQKQGSQVCWINERLVRSNPKKVSYWTSSIFSVFIRDLGAIFHHLSRPVSLDLIDRVLREHARQSGLFSLKNLLALRSKGYLSRSVYREYGSSIAQYGDHSESVVFLISIFPKTLLAKAKKYFF